MYLLLTSELGALLEEVPEEGGPLKINGSTLVCVAASKEEIIEILKKDIYSESGVWDFSKVRDFEVPEKCSLTSEIDPNLSFQVCFQKPVDFRIIRSREVRFTQRCKANIKTISVFVDWQYQNVK